MVWVQDDVGEQHDDLFDFDYELGLGAPVADSGTPVAHVEGEEEVNVQEKIEIPDEMVEEGRAAVGLRTPVSVSKAQKDEHELTHCPYRAWCSICVKARGQKMPHNYHKDADVDEFEGPRSLYGLLLYE